jgi:hypothetical protein
MNIYYARNQKVFKQKKKRRINLTQRSLLVVRFLASPEILSSMKYGKDVPVLRKALRHERIHGRKSDDPRGR